MAKKQTKLANLVSSIPCPYCNCRQLCRNDRCASWNQPMTDLGLDWEGGIVVTHKYQCATCGTLRLHGMHYLPSVTRHPRFAEAVKAGLISPNARAS